MKLEYVASGCRGVKFLSKFILDNEECLDVCRNHISKMNNSVEGHNFSTLFNALIEPNLGKDMKNYYSDCLYGIHADSGGLQEVTLGKKITDKKDIFSVQSKYSDIAMSFDEIPVYIPDGKATIQGSGTRLYSRELLEPKAKQTGINLRNQIRYFSENDSKSKIFLILQGNCFDSYQKWLDVIWQEIKDEDLSYIGGIASAAAALGAGTLEDFKRAYIVSNLEYPEMFQDLPIHVLGVGSIYRLMPFLVSKNLQDRHISYDSTSFTKSMFMGSFYSNQTLKDFDPNNIDKSIKDYHNSGCHDHIIKHGLYQFSDIELAKYQIEPGGDRLDRIKNEEDMISMISTRMSFFSSMVFSFYDDCNSVLSGDYENFKSLDKRTKKGYLPALKSFKNIRDVKDYNDWKAFYSTGLKSNAYPVKENQMIYEVF